MRCLSNKFNWLMYSILLLFYITSPTYAQTIAIGINEQAEGVRAEFTLPPGVKAKSFTLKNPPRLVIDIPNAGKKPAIRLPNGQSSNVIGNIRSGQFNADTGRLVLDINYRFTMVSEQRSNKLRVLISPYGERVATTKHTAPPPKPKPKKKIIVIDAGHGGQDPGAIGKGGTKEKNLVLKFAKELKKALESTGKYEAILTREGDYYIALRKRLTFARNHDADMFLSIHADSASSKARGLSVYTLSENASDKEAEALAVKENKSDIIAGVNLGKHDKDVADILISLAQRETNNQSTILADTLVSSLGNQKIRLLSRPHRFAGFAVLKAPDVPSVLVEIGFLSNRSEEKTLNKSSYRRKLASSLTKAISHYFDTTSHAFE